MDGLDAYYLNRLNVARSLLEKTTRFRKRLVFQELLDKVKNEPSVGIVGLRGVGKTTMMLQMLPLFKDGFYFSADSLVIRGLGLYEFLEYLHARGHGTVFVDEVHYYPEWSRELKAAYDDFGMKLVFTGSSRLSMEARSEMLRRAAVHHVPPLSFREYLHLYLGTEFEKLSLEDILDTGTRKTVLARLSGYARELDNFLAYGGLPLGLESKDPTRYLGVIRRVVDEDIPAVRRVGAEFRTAVYKVLRIVATSQPGEISIHTLSKASGKHPETVEDILLLLESAGILVRIPPSGQGPKSVRKTVKLTLTVPFRSVLCHSYGTHPSKGALREDFFVHHLPGVSYYASAGKRAPDYVFDRIVFEIGGASKTRAQFRQVRGYKNYLVIDGMTLEEHKLPLVLFGLLW